MTQPGTKDLEHTVTSLPSKYTKRHLQDIATGACFLGSGGGGTLQSAMNLLSRFEKGTYYPADMVESVNIGEARDGYTVVTAYIGAPAKINNAFYPEGPVQAVLQIQKRLREQGKELKYIMPVETGALGFTVPCLVAAKLGLKVVNADGAGRAVPSLPQLTFAYADNISPLPAFVANQKDTSTSSASDTCIEVSVKFLEQAACSLGSASKEFNLARIVDGFMRPIISEPAFDQFGGLALWLMSPEQLSTTQVVLDTIRKAHVCSVVLNNCADADLFIQEFNRILKSNAKLLFGPGELSVPEDSGKAGEGGFDFGKIIMTSETGETCTSLYQNETLVSYTKDEEALCGAPDSIAYVLIDHAMGRLRVFSNGDLLTPKGTLREEFKGQLFYLIGVPGDPALWSNNAIVSGFKSLIQNLGYKGKWKPLQP